MARIHRRLLGGVILDDAGFVDEVNTRIAIKNKLMNLVSKSRNTFLYGYPDGLMSSFKSTLGLKK